MIRRILVSVVLVYLAFLALLYFFQRDLMYQPDRYNLNINSMTMKDFVGVKLKAEDGVNVYAWYRLANDNAPTIIYFHGNAETVPDNIAFLRSLGTAGFNVMALEYRGYGSSYEKTTEEGIYYDARAAIDRVRKSTPDSKIILFGRSLGTAVAMKMASEYNVGGVVLLSPFTSAEDIAQMAYPYFPIKALGLVKDKYDSLSIVDEVAEPVLIFHGRKDALVPLSNAEELAKALGLSPYNFIVIDDADHINGFDNDKMIAAINAFAGRQNDIPAVTN